MPVRKVMAVAALWILPLLIVAPLFSRDVYSYAAQGEMMSHHINPYHYGPGVLGAPPVVNLVDPLWLNTPAPYGPLFMQVDGILTSLSSAPRAGRRDPPAAAGHRRRGPHGPRHLQPGPQPWP